MRYLLDTSILVWTLGAPDRLPDEASEILADPEPMIWFSAVNIWEIGIKSSLGRPDFDLNPHLARTTSLQLGFVELHVDGLHAASASDLPHLHSDPFDRLLIAQAITTGATLVTSDRTIARYQGPIKLVS
ncbi:type II toxin-antitoxin system VapC family toxin [Isoptericola variabilis]|uniref:PilT protein domain protein n=1 Tax=Isoptericola variabilis (strain 225) TaxID=743718 RepID=F6FSY2_ISOV2|nr:type II toxin-antitoxin system VapC family toxin [Isoptericola variabilis]AEG43123.1 PilT protein domain protein [Isoptericola variabilis 225]TWH35052.1 PIN domain nuclease of toxin-antitoxin system [Isoptericola variabilis J7]